MIEPDRPQMSIYVIRRMRFACWITKATDTLRIYNTYCFSISTMVTRTRLNVTLYVHSLSCFVLLLNAVTTVRCTETEILRLKCYKVSFYLYPSALEKVGFIV
jgi:hypothetical protein